MSTDDNSQNAPANEPKPGRRRCTAIRRDGRPCQAFGILGTDRCVGHHALQREFAGCGGRAIAAKGNRLRTRADARRELSVLYDAQANGEITREDAADRRRTIELWMRAYDIAQPTAPKVLADGSPPTTLRTLDDL